MYAKVNCSTANTNGRFWARRSEAARPAVDPKRSYKSRDPAPQSCSSTARAEQRKSKKWTRTPPTVAIALIQRRHHQVRRAMALSASAPCVRRRCIAHVGQCGAGDVRHSPPTPGVLCFTTRGAYRLQASHPMQGLVRSRAPTPCAPYQAVSVRRTLLENLLRLTARALRRVPSARRAVRCARRPGPPASRRRARRGGPGRR